MPRKKRITKKILFKKSVEVLQPLLNLQDWKLIVRFSSRMKNAADCEASPEYKEALIRVNSSRFSEFTYHEIVSIAAHEMMHCVVWPLAAWTEMLCMGNSTKLEMTRQLEEGLVTDLEKLIMNFATDRILEKLREDGYQAIDLTFKELDV